MINARIYIRIFMAILFLGMMPSCTYDTIHVNGLNENANVTLTLALGDQSLQVSRATVPDEAPENEIKTVDLYFYKAGDGESVSPKHVEEGLVPKEGKISFSMPVDNFNELFPNDAVTSCQVFAIVNRPATPNGTNVKYPKDTDNVLPTDKTVENLKNMVLYSDFASTQTSFVMHSINTDEEGEEIEGSNGMVTINRTQTNGLNGTIPVKRVAAKIGLQLVYPEEAPTDYQNKLLVYNGTVVEWYAGVENVKISLRRGSSRAYLGTDDYSAQSADIFSTAYTNLVTGTGDQAKYVSLYTYPTNWTQNENARTHLMLVVTWTKADNSEEKKETFYEINVNPAGSYTERNHYYQILQEISVLGSEEEEKPLILEDASYKVLQWQSTDGSSGSLSRPRYLMVEETAITLQNVATKKIYFNSSDPIELTDVEVLWNNTQPQVAVDLSMATKDHATPTELSNGDIQYVISNTAAVSGVANRIQGDYKVTITIHNATNEGDRSYIEVNHNLDNGMESTSDYTAYTINLSVAHQDDANYKENVKITQYPMLSIVADRNTDATDDNSNNDSKGFVYINGSNSSNTGWMRVNGLGLNTCTNRYIVSVSTLNEGIGENYIIGDPRTTSRKITVDNNELSNYLPADVNSSAKLISPQFMLASSYGACPSQMTKEEAERRCATYQEDGYPAGRWRLPTEAEIKYAVQLFDWGVIPELFSSSMDYWSAQGKIDGASIENLGNSGSGVVRCVYDTWYWGTEHTPGSTTYVYDDTRD